MLKTKPISDAKYSSRNMNINGVKASKIILITKPLVLLTNTKTKLAIIKGIRKKTTSSAEITNDAKASKIQIPIITTNCASKRLSLIKTYSPLTHQATLIPEQG